MPEDFKVKDAPDNIFVRDFFQLKSDLEGRMSRLEGRLSVVEEREKMKDKMWQERLVFVGIIVALVVALLVHGH